MFIGHWAPALAAAAMTPKAPRLGVLFIAAQFVDWFFFFFAIAGIENLAMHPQPEGFNRMDLHDMPYTHSLVGNLAFAALFAALVWAATRNQAASLVAGTVAVSHWFVDVISHRPDMTIAGGEPRLGFGLLDNEWIAVPAELGITFGALYWYARRTQGKALPLALLALVLFAVQLLQWFWITPEQVTLSSHLLALSVFGAISAIAFWVGQTRSYCASRG